MFLQVRAGFQHQRQTTSTTPITTRSTGRNAENRQLAVEGFVFDVSRLREDSELDAESPRNAENQEGE